jgi:AraC-like DNA-binding protein
MGRVDLQNLGQWHKWAWESGFSSAVLSKQLQVSPRQLQRYTRQLFGRSAQDWLDEQRLIAAAGVLKKHRSVKFAAYHVGFKQVSHFSREFKLHYGVTPTGFLEWSDRQGAKRRDGSRR